MVHGDAAAGRTTAERGRVAALRGPPKPCGDVSGDQRDDAEPTEHRAMPRLQRRIGRTLEFFPDRSSLGPKNARCSRPAGVVFGYSWPVLRLTRYTRNGAITTSPAARAA